MKRGCPNISCRLSSKSVKAGFFRRSSDSKKIQRYKCLACGKYYSNSTFSQYRWEKKRRINAPMYRLMASGNSQRRMARLLGVNVKTIARRFLPMAKRLEMENNKYVILLKDIKQIQLDEMESWVHSKLKPVSILITVEKDTRRILIAKASYMPAKGLIKGKSLKKYGPIKDERRHLFHEELNRLSLFHPEIESIESDKNPRYPYFIKKYYPKAQYTRYKGRRGCVVGQGELKTGGFDPLFSLNHTCAMLRANINRLFRRTWCTSKSLQHLNAHLQIYMHYHNHNLVT